MSNYWAERMAKAQTAISNKSIKQIDKQIAKYYDRAMRNTINDFESTYNKLLATVGEGKEPTPADLYKLDKYWEAQAQMRRELQLLGERQLTTFSKIFETNFFEIYYSIAIPSATAFNTISTEAARQMINQIWVADGKSWSQRIWDNVDRLAETLNEELLDIVITGKKSSALKQKLQERFGVSFSQADAIARTEIAHIQTQAAQQRYKDYGIQEVEVWADEDERRCDVCGKLHQKRFPSNSQMPIPAHPRCRCCVIPVVE
jgi:SPP1 gp7 family putative phage head morphogenesis protein